MESKTVSVFLLLLSKCENQSGSRQSAWCVVLSHNNGQNLCLRWEGAGHLDVRCVLKGLWKLSVPFCVCPETEKVHRDTLRALCYAPMMIIADLQPTNRRQNTFPHRCTSTKSTSGYYRHGNRCNRHWCVHEKPLIDFDCSPELLLVLLLATENICVFPSLLLRTFDSPWTKSGILSAVPMAAARTKWYFSTSAWQQENKEAQDEFFGRPLFELLIM